MNFKGRSAKSFIANSTNNLKKAWAIQQAEIKAIQEAKDQIIKDEIKKAKYQLKLKRDRERYRAKKEHQLKLKGEKMERPLPMTKEECRQHCQNLLDRVGISREQVQEQIKQVPRVKSNTLVETIYGYKRVKDALYE